MTEPHRPAGRRPLRLFSLEGALGAFGLFSLASGLYQGELTAIFWGVTILVGLVILALVRRRDWQQHWAARELPPAAPTGEDRQPPASP